MSRMSNEEAIAVIKKEAECVKRQGKTGECCRDDLGCGACDLVEKDTNIFAAYFLAIEALNRPHGEWEYLKEHITEMRDADGELNQKQTCQFILELMGVIEREGDRN